MKVTRGRAAQRWGQLLLRIPTFNNIHRSMCHSLAAYWQENRTIIGIFSIPRTFPGPQIGIGCRE